MVDPVALEKAAEARFTYEWSGIRWSDTTEIERDRYRKEARHTIEAYEAAKPKAADPLADLVSRFSAALLEKLMAARAKYGFDDEGWLADDWDMSLRRQIREHIEKGDPRDVAAYCAFAWHHGWSLTSPVPTSEAAKPKAGWLPIERAPWDGKPVLLWRESTREHYVAARLRGEHGPGWCTPDGFEIFGATHFMPLPAAPEPTP